MRNPESTRPRPPGPGKAVPHLLTGTLLTLLLVSGLSADAGVPFTLFVRDEYSNGLYPDYPYFILKNESRNRITRMEITIGDINKNFDAVWLKWAPPGGTVTVESPDSNLSGGTRSDTLKVTFTNFDPGESAYVFTEIDPDDSNSSQDFRTILFNNGPEAQNAVVKVWDDQGNMEELELADPGAADLSRYTFVTDSRSRTLTVRSVSEATASDYVKTVRVKINGNFVRTNSSGGILINATTGGELVVGQVQSLIVYDSDTVEIIAPQEVYKDINGVDITDSVATDPVRIQDEAEERYTALGISVNDVPQTGDPTYYRFDVSQNTDVVVKWRHDYALTIDSDIDNNTTSQLDPGYAGPMTSKAEGNPEPAVNKHWIKKDEIITTEVDGAVLDFSHPGLDIRYVAMGYRASGPPNISNPNGTNEGVFAWPNTPVANVAALRGAMTTPALRQSVPGFTMSRPAKITYLWQIQFGVKVNADMASRAAVPVVFSRSPTNSSVIVPVGIGEGIFWFYPGDWVRVATLANADSLALNGWLNGDGYYFPSSGTINSATGNPSGESTNVNVNASWTNSFTASVNNITGTYRGLEIGQLARPARVLWTYGAQAIAVDAFIGEYVFQTNPLQPDPNLKTNFTIPPDNIFVLSISGRNQNVAATDMTVWDPQAKKLFPLVPGQFRATWRRGPNLTITNDVIVTVHFPPTAHYPYVAGTAPVALDPDPNDDFIFKALKYSENNASVDANNWFTASERGKSVLLFGNIQTGTRGEPREFVEVRVVDTRTYEEVLDQGTATIGEKITAADLDLANLGTGFVMSFQDATGQPDRARYNPFIYDRSKLDGLSANDIYDMARLRSTSKEKVIVAKENLPGPIIPVNLHPGALKTERIIVVWYDDPTENDNLLWPRSARIYTPQWPDDPGKIVIASQYGSESQVFDADSNVVDQVVVPELVVPDVGTFDAETTYNPSRLQEVQVYSQPDRNAPGYNPNEEHALIAPSLRFADVSPRPPAVYALRDNDLNDYSDLSSDESGQPASYTSHPYVLVQFYDTADEEYKMRVYEVVKEDALYRFANQAMVTPGTDGVAAATPRQLQLQPYVSLEAGEPVIPFYPLGVVIGASPCGESFGINIKGQNTYWEDYKGTSWAISGGTNAWFTVQFYYPLQPDFWWPPGKPGAILGNAAPSTEDPASTGTIRISAVPQIGDCISFLPTNSASLLDLAENVTVDDEVFAANAPIKILFKSEWPAIAPVLKAGETLTFSGGEYRADHPTMQVIDDDGEIKSVATPGLPGLLAFAEAEVVFDSLNPGASNALWKSSWTARVTQVLDQRSVPLPIGDFPSELLPATGRTRVKDGKYVFNDLPASLQKRVRFDPLSVSTDPLTGLQVNGRLEMTGLLNDKDIGDPTLTAAPPAVYVLEPNIMTADDRMALEALDEGDGTAWDAAVQRLYDLTRNPDGLTATNEYLAGLEPAIVRNTVTGLPETEVVNGITQYRRDPSTPAPYRAFGPGLALVPNAGFLDPQGMIPGGGPYPDVSWITVVENNDPSLAGSPITPHVIKVDRRERYRGAIKTVLSDNVFDENVVLRHTGDFGANAGELFFEWWYRPDDGSLNVPPPDLLRPGQANPWKLFPDPTGKRGQGRYQVTLKGNPNAPEALLADTFWFCRYRHRNDRVSGSDWNVSQPDGSPRVNFTWAGAGNSDPFNDFDGDGFMDYRAQLAQGWIKRVLDAVNPYEARIRDFEGDSPSTKSSMIAELGPRFEGPVALNPDKDVIENVGLIELYETILKRGSDLSINLSTPVSTPAIANALELASTRLADFYTILGNEAYGDAEDPTIGIGSSSTEYGSLAPAVFAFQNQMSSMIEEELALLRGVDDYFARPVYNRLFWNFTKGEGEAAYAMNYDISDENSDGFIDEADAMIEYPQGHGDAWGHYLTSTKYFYNLLRHEYFNWVSRSEFYNLQDIVIKVDFLDERKFAQTAAAKAKTGAEIVNLTYREKYVEDPNAQWQGYTDSNKDRAWGVQGWARRAAQGAYFDWVTANALLPSQHPNTTLEGIQKVDRKENADIAVISANLNAVQNTFDQANKGQNPLGLAGNVVPFDINPQQIDDLVYGRTHFEQIYDRAIAALANAVAVWDNANENRNRIRKIADDETEFRNSTFQQDLSYRNQLIKIFGRPYEGTVGPGKVYPAGYDGPDLLLFMYVDVRQIDNTTVPGPTEAFASFNTNGVLTSGDIYRAFVNGEGNGRPGRATLSSLIELDQSVRALFAPTYAEAANGTNNILARDGLYSVNYTDLTNPKVPLENLAQLMPITAAGYTFQAPPEWGSRPAVGDLQQLITQMMQQEAAVASAIGAWDSLQGEIVRTLRLANAKLDMAANMKLKNEIFVRTKTIILETIKGIEGVIETIDALDEIVTTTYQGLEAVIPTDTPTAGLAFSAGDVLAPVKGGITAANVAVQAGMNAWVAGFKIAQTVAEGTLAIAENELELFSKREEAAIAAKELLVDLENKTGDEPIKRIEVFKEIQALRALSDQYRSLVNEGARLVDERAAFNKRVAAQTQRNRYQDMTFRVSRNHALQNYRSALDIAARYAYLAAKAYDYETSFDPSDPGSPSDIFTEIIRARSIGQFDGDAHAASGGLSEALAHLKMNYDLYKGQLGINNPQLETGKMSLRTEHFRIQPSEPPAEFAQVEYLTNTFANSTGTAATVTTLITLDDPTADQSREGVYGFSQFEVDPEDAWKETLQDARVDDLWQVPEYRHYCRPFASETDPTGTNHVAEPGLVIRFSTEVMAGRNFFGRPLAGGDHAYDPSHFATKIRGVGVWFSDYLSEDVLNDLPVTPRVYLIPVGADIMSVPTSADPGMVRMWKVVDQRIPTPMPSASANLDNMDWIPLLDSLDGRLGDPRKYPMFRAYHDGGSEVNTDELVTDSRLIGRSIWNTQWLLIIPGRELNYDPNVGLDRFIEQVSDIKLVFETYGYSGN